MDVFPARADFIAAYTGGAAQVLWTALAGDVDTPVSVMLKLGQERAYSALLESVEGGATRGRYSFTDDISNGRLNCLTILNDRN